MNELRALYESFAKGESLGAAHPVEDFSRECLEIYRASSDPILVAVSWTIGSIFWDIYQAVDDGPISTTAAQEWFRQLDPAVRSVVELGENADPADVLERLAQMITAFGELIPSIGPDRR